MIQALGHPTDSGVAGTRIDIIRWWESRRLRFNIYVGAVGAVSWLLVLTAGAAAVKPGEDFEEPVVMLFGPFLYGFLANVCYTLGWLVDTIFYCGVPRSWLHRAGLIFSMLLTAFPVCGPFWHGSSLPTPGTNSTS